MIAYRQNSAALRHVPEPVCAPVETTERPDPSLRAWHPVVARECCPATLTLIREIRIAATITGRGVSRIGREAVGDPRLYHDLTLGRELRERTRHRVQAYLRSLASQHTEASHG